MQQQQIIRDVGNTGLLKQRNNRCKKINQKNKK